MKNSGEMTVLISNIQRLSIHDGPGLRTTIFLKGCSIRCPWCANPENIEIKNQLWFDANKCIGTENNCILNPACSKPKAECLVGKVKETGKVTCCEAGALSWISREYTINELYDVIVRDAAFFGDDGGVTFSGGEPLLQMDKLELLMKRLKEDGYHLCIETSLFASTKLLEIALQYIDFFYVDMKILNRENCKKYLNGNITQYFYNLRLIEESRKLYIIRIPLIKPFTFNENNLKQILYLLNTLHPQGIEIFRAHRLADKKYTMIGKKMYDFEEIADEEFDTFLNKLRSRKLNIHKLSF